jgi:hypothetical protein
MIPNLYPAPRGQGQASVTLPFWRTPRFNNLFKNLFIL